MCPPCVPLQIGYNPPELKAYLLLQTLTSPLTISHRQINLPGFSMKD